MPKQLLIFTQYVDRLNDRFGVVASWLVLIAVLVSAGNALIRYGFNLSSNAWLEVQWYLFAGMVMLGAATTFRLNEHVFQAYMSSCSRCPPPNPTKDS